MKIPFAPCPVAFGLVIRAADLELARFPGWGAAIASATHDLRAISAVTESIVPRA